MRVDKKFERMPLCRRAIVVLVRSMVVMMWMMIVWWRGRTMMVMVDVVIAVAVFRTWTARIVHLEFLDLEEI